MLVILNKTEIDVVRALAKEAKKNKGLIEEFTVAEITTIVRGTQDPTDKQKRHVRNSFRRLIREGLIIKGKSGFYSLTEEGFYLGKCGSRKRESVCEFGELTRRMSVEPGKEPPPKDPTKEKKKRRPYPRKKKEEEKSVANVEVPSILSQVEKDLEAPTKTRSPFGRRRDKLRTPVRKSRKSEVVEDKKSADLAKKIKAEKKKRASHSQLTKKVKSGGNS